MSASAKSSKEIAAAARQNTSSYRTEIPPSANAARRLLEIYSGIAPADVYDHISNIRDQAWAVFPYGGIGSFSFLDFTSTLEDPNFQGVTTRLTAPGSTETFLDVGCAFGTVVRQLNALGVSGERLFGTDLQPRFLELGNELFRDGQIRSRSSGITFVAGDMLDENDVRLDVLNGRIDIIYASAFFHLFEAQDQIKAAKRMVHFLKTQDQNPGPVVFGCNGGPRIAGSEKYVLDADAWREVWDVVGQETGTRWKTEMEVIEDNEDRIRTRFVVYRAS
ncbi:hypothetical protein V8F33_005158 [Rhypophila sp. PSN 637]